MNLMKYMEAGNVVEMKNGNRFLIFKSSKGNKTLINGDTIWRFNPKDYNDNLENLYCLEFNICKIYSGERPHNIIDSISKNVEIPVNEASLIWEIDSNIEVGDKVRIVDNGQLYTSYDDFFIENNLRKYVGKYVYGEYPNADADADEFTVVGRGNHRILKERVLFAIQNKGGQVYLIGKSGIKKNY